MVQMMVPAPENDPGTGPRGSLERDVNGGLLPRRQREVVVRVVDGEDPCVVVFLHGCGRSRSVHREMEEECDARIGPLHLECS